MGPMGSHPAAAGRGLTPLVWGLGASGTLCANVITTALENLGLAVDPEKGKAETKREGAVTPPTWVRPVPGPRKGGADPGFVCSLCPQCCGVDFEVKAFATDSADGEDEKIPRK